MQNPTGKRSVGLLRSLTGPEGLAGRLALSWCFAGGVSMEVVLVLASAVSGVPEAAAVPFTAIAFFLAGAAGGFVHGALVGMAGRPPGVDFTAGVQGIEAAVLWAVPGLLPLSGVALWISMTSMATEAGRPGIVAGVAAAWVATLGVCIWAAFEARKGFRHALRRWPERRPGIALVSATFVVLLVSFLYVRPEIWFTDLRVSPLGAVFLALGATVWIALPVLVVALHFLHQRHQDSPIWDGPSPVTREDSR